MATEARSPAAATTPSSAPPARPPVLRWRVIALVSTFIAILISLGYVTHRETVDQEEAALRVEHTHLVIEELARIPSGLAAAESSLRGYALQRDERFLEEIEPALREVEVAEATVRRMTGDNPAQQRRLDDLAPKIRRRLALLRERTASVRANGSDEVTAEARELTSEIRSAIGEMAHAEEVLLERRRMVREAHTQRLRLVSPLGIFAGICLVLVALGLVVAEGTRRQRAERAADEQGARLRHLVKESAFMLQVGEMLGACRSVEEANAVVEQLAPRFFSAGAGAVCMLNESQNLLESHVRWGDHPLLTSTAFPPEECWALRRGKAHRSEIRDATRCAHLGEIKSAALCIPLLANGQLVGTFHVADERNDGALVERRATLMGEQVGMALSNLRLRDTLRNQSIRDALTGLFNRRYNDETLGRELHRASREATTLSVLVMDVDYFKKFNDTFGHQAGDRVLASLGSFLRKSTRVGDIASRIGGEELAVVLPGARLSDASKKAEEIRHAVSKMAIVHEGKDIGPVTLSIGVAAFPQHGTNAEELVRVADTALYRAKREGRNRVIVAD